jgi:hypothetical protein
MGGTVAYAHASCLRRKAVLCTDILCDQVTRRQSGSPSLVTVRVEDAGQKVEPFLRSDVCYMHVTHFYLQ